MDYDGSSSEEEEAPPNFECAIAELLAAGFRADVRPLLQECLEEFSVAPESLRQAYQLLPPTEQEQLNLSLPAGDAARTDGLRNPALNAALRATRVHGVAKGGVHARGAAALPQCGVDPRRGRPLRGQLRGDRPRRLRTATCLSFALLEFDAQSAKKKAVGVLYVPTVRPPPGKGSCDAPT